MSGNDSYLPMGSTGEPGYRPMWSPEPPADAPTAAPTPQRQTPTPPGGWSGYGPGAPPSPPPPYGSSPYGASPYGAPAPTAPTYAVPAYAPTYGGPVQGAPGAPGAQGAPVYGMPTYGSQPYGAQPYAPAPVKTANGWAVASFVVSLVMLVVGVVSGFYFGSLFVVWMGVYGLRKAKALEQAAYGPRGRALAWWGVSVGVLNFVLVMVLKIAAI